MMTPHKSRGKGTFYIDRRYPGVGRIRRASGTTDPKLFQKLLDMLDELKGRVDILRAVRDGRLAPLELWGSYRAYGLSRLPTSELAKPLEAALWAWWREAQIVHKTKLDYKYAIQHILKLARPHTTVAELPALLVRYREKATAGSFNHMRAVLRSFAHETSGRFSDLWNGLGAVPRKKPGPRSKRRPWTPDEARGIAGTLAGNVGGMWWTLCCSGMSGGPLGPYFLDAFEVHDDHLAIHGTKRAGRERVVPRITTPIRKVVRYAEFLNQLTALGVKPNDGRRSFEAWMEAAAIPKARRRRYMGHGVQDVTDLYGDDYPMQEFVGQDAERMRHFIGKDWTVRLEVMG
jgi:hypothetical protein